MAAVTRRVGFGDPFNGDGTAENEAASAGAVGRYNDPTLAITDIDDNLAGDDVTLLAYGENALTFTMAATYTRTVSSVASLLIQPAAGYEPSGEGPQLMIDSNVNGDSWAVTGNGLVTYRGIHFRNTRATPSARVIEDANDDIFEDCFITSNATTGYAFRANGGTYRNTRFHRYNTGGTGPMFSASGAAATTRLEGCKIIHESTSAATIFDRVNTSHDHILENTAIFCATAGSQLTDQAGGGGISVGAGNARNANLDTNLGSCDFDVTALSFTDGVDFVAPSTDDFRAQSGGALDGSGTGGSGTSVDMFGTSRDATNPWIGYYEEASASEKTASGSSDITALSPSGAAVKVGHSSASGSAQPQQLTADGVATNVAAPDQKTASGSSSMTAVTASGASILTGSDHEYLDMTAQPSTAYVYRAEARDAAGNTATTAGLNTTTPAGDQQNIADGSAQIGSMSAAGSASAGQPSAQPVWDDTFINLPDAQVGVLYSVNLKDYGVDIDEVYEVFTNQSPDDADSFWVDDFTLDPVTGILSGTPTAPVDGIVVNVMGTNGTFDAAADWADRSTLSNIRAAYDFPTDASVRDVSDAMSGNQPRSQWDQTVKLYGAGSLRQEILGTDSYPAHPANWRATIMEQDGNWMTPAGVGSHVKMQVGEEMWCAGSMRHNRAEGHWLFSKTGGGVQHVFKFFLIDERTSSSVAEIVAQSRWGKAMGYTGLGTGFNWQDAIASACSGTDFEYAPEIDNGPNPLIGFDPGLPSGNGAGSAFTACQQDRGRRGGFFSYGNGPDGIPDPLAGGMTVLANFWYSWRVHFHRLAASSTLVEWHWAPLGQDWIPLYTEVVPHGIAFGTVTLTNSHTEMAAESGVRPDCKRWYDGFIFRFGSEGIPAPGFA